MTFSATFPAEATDHFNREAYVGVDFSSFGAGEAIMLTFTYDPQTGRSMMSSGYDSNRE
jgi:hypothetical protein